MINHRLAWLPVLALIPVTAGITGCTSDLVTRLKGDPADGLPQVVPLTSKKKVAMPYALRRTRLNTQIKFDVIKVTTMNRVEGGDDTEVAGSERYELWPSTGDEALTCTADYPNDPKLTFEILADERSKAFVGVNETFEYDTAGRLSSISADYSGKAAKTVKFIINTTFSLAKMGVSMGLFTATPTYEKREVLSRKIVVKKTIHPETLAGQTYYSVSFKEAINREVSAFEAREHIADIEWKFDDILFKLDTGKLRLASSGTLRAKIEKSSVNGLLTGLPVRIEAPSATVSFTLIGVAGSALETLAESEIPLPELADITFLPFPSNPWRATLKTSLELNANGSLKKFGRETSSAALDTAGNVNSIAENLTTKIPELSDHIASKKKAEASLRLKTLTQEIVVKQKEAEVRAKTAAAKSLTDETLKAQARTEIEVAKAQLEIEREKLNYLRRGIEVGG